VDFNVYYPGAGVGAHCLPVDPYHLVTKAKGAGVSFEGYYGGQGA
jgi:UDP-N-acetyl-D-mannosaminuronate dehydrogenase